MLVRYFYPSVTITYGVEQIHHFVIVLIERFQNIHHPFSGVPYRAGSEIEQILAFIVDFLEGFVVFQTRYI